MFYLLLFFLLITSFFSERNILGAISDKKCIPDYIFIFYIRILRRNVFFILNEAALPIMLTKKKLINKAYEVRKFIKAATHYFLANN